MMEPLLIIALPLVRLPQLLTLEQAWYVPLPQSSLRSVVVLNQLRPYRSSSPPTSRSPSTLKSRVPSPQPTPSSKVSIPHLAMQLLLPTSPLSLAASRSTSTRPISTWALIRTTLPLALLELAIVAPTTDWLYWVMSS